MSYFPFAFKAISYSLASSLAYLIRATFLTHAQGPSMVVKEEDSSSTPSMVIKEEDSSSTLCKEMQTS
jgi:hypothetical protein